MEFADDHHFVDFSSPEGNNHGLFVQYIEGLRNQTNDGLIGKVRIWLTGMTDLRDFNIYKHSFLVLIGRALLVFFFNCAILFSQ